MLVPITGCEVEVTSTTIITGVFDDVFGDAPPHAVRARVKPSAARASQYQAAIFFQRIAHLLESYKQLSAHSVLLSIECLLLECSIRMGVIVPCSSMRNKPLAKQFGATVRRLRQEKGISQERFAALSGIHRTYMGSIERGEKVVTIETANKIAKALDLPMSRLFLAIEVEQESIVIAPQGIR